jgi:hypothetical protein
LAALLSIAGGAVDLTVAWQRDQTAEMAEQVVCRLHYPHPGNPDLFFNSVAQWSAISGSAWPDCPIAETPRLRYSLTSYADLAV